jgi:HPr kinase/phosphorylase
MTSVPPLTATDVFEAQKTPLKLKWIAGREGKSRQLEPATARFPGMALVGHLNFIHPNRVQVVGAREIDYLESLDAEVRDADLERMFAYPGCAMVVITDGLTPPRALHEFADNREVPLFTSTLPSPKLIDALQYYLARALAERVAVHGVFMEVLGIGVLLTGESGIGKSEVALELLSRNHRLIADDAVEIARVAPATLEGRCPDALQGFMEVRGLGILNVRAMFGETSTRREKTLELVVRFERMTKASMETIDRLQAERQTRAILDVPIPEVVLLVAPGRNLAVLVEAAARNQIQHKRGSNALEDLMAQQQAVMESGSSPTGSDSDESR